MSRAYLEKKLKKTNGQSNSKNSQTTQKVGAGSRAPVQMTELGKRLMEDAKKRQKANAVTGVPSLAESVQQNIYTPGQSASLQRGMAMGISKKYTSDLGMLRDSIASGKIFEDSAYSSMLSNGFGDGYDQEKVKKVLLDELDNVLGINVSTYDSARARQGDWSVLDGLDEGSDQYKEYYRLLRKYGYDETEKAFKDVIPTQSSAADMKKSMMLVASGDLPAASEKVSAVTAPAKTYEDLFNIQQDYTRDEVEKDLSIIAGFINGGYVNDYGAYEEAAKRLGDYFGGDWSVDNMRSQSAAVPILGENNIPWYDDTLGKYDADTQVMRDKMSGQNFTYEDYVAYWKAVQAQQEAEAQKNKFLAEWSQKMQKWEPHFAAADFEQYSADLVDPYANTGFYGAYNAYKGAMHGDQNDTTGYAYMSEDELKKYSYLANNPQYGKEVANEYLKDLQENLYRLRQEDIVQRTAEAADEHGASMWIGARGSTAWNNMVEGPKNIVRNITGQEISPYDPSFDAANYAQITDAVNVQNIKDATNGVELAGINLPAAAYQAVSSSVDSGIAALYGGKSASVLFGTGTFNTTLQEGLKAGQDQLDAAIDAAVFGLIEVGTEKFSIDALLGDGTSALKHLFKNALTEPTEELFGEILRESWDAIRNGDDSEFNRRISELQYQGYAPDEALRQAWKERAHEMLETEIVSFLSGDISGSFGAVNIYNTNRQYGDNILKNGNGNTRPFLDAVNSIDGLDPSTKKMIQQEYAAQDALDAAQKAAEPPKNASEQTFDEFDESTAEESAEPSEAAQKAAEPTKDESEQVFDEFAEESAEPSNTVQKEATQKAAEQKPSGKKDGKVPKSSAARLGRIFREAMSRLDEQSKAVLADYFSSNQITAMLDERAALDKVAPDAPMKKLLANAVAKVINGQQITQEEARMLTTSNAAMATVRDLTAAVAERDSINATAAELAAMADRNPGKSADQLVEETVQQEAAEEAAELESDMVEPGLTIDEYAAEYGNNADLVKSVFESGSTRNATEFAHQFKIAYNYGSDGRNLGEMIRSGRLDALTDAQKTAAYNLGRDVRIAKYAAAREASPTGVTVGNVDRSAISGMRLNAAQNASVSAIGRMAKAVGFNVKFVASQANADGKYTSENGRYDRATRTITIDVNAGRLSTESANYAMMQTAGHELTHYIKQFADTGMYSDYQEFVLNHLSLKMKEGDIDARIQNTIDNNAKLGKTLSREQAIDEIVADASGDVLMSLTESDIREMAQTKPTLLQTIGKFFERWIASVKALIKQGYSGQTNRNAIAEQMLDVADELGRKWVALLKDANVRAVESTDRNGNVAVAENAMTGESEFMDDESVSFSMREPVEQTRNLIAVHNITEDKLKKALALGGFPMPSIAIAKRDIGHQNFGSISLVFGRDTIDPKANKKNKVYSADAWTPTFPQIEYEVDSKVDSRVYNKLSNLKRVVDPYFSDDLSRMMYGVEDQMNRNGGEEGLVQRALDNYGMKAAYLEDNGEHITPATRTEVQQSTFSEKQIEKYTQIADLVGAENIRNMSVLDIFNLYGDAINEIYPGASANTIRFNRIIQNVYRYLTTQNSAPTTKTVTDIAATHRMIDEAIDADAYERWVRNLYSGIEKASGVYNGKEIFTPSGNRRSFASTHYPANVQGIAKAMYDAHDGNVKNVSANHDVKSLRAVTSKTFKSIEEMHKDEERLKARTQEEADALTAALDSRLTELANRVMDTNPKSRDTYASLMEHDQVVSILQEAAAKKYSAATIKAIYAQYGYSVSDADAQAFKKLLDDVSAMPVNIFEAKPERAVYFDEVKFAVVPDTIDDGLRQSLEGVVEDVRVYPDGDETARLEALNSRPDVQFSVRDVSDEASSIRNQIKEHQDELNAMTPVADKTTSLPADYNNKTERIAWAMERLAESGYQVERDDIGIIVFDRKRIKTALGYIHANDNGRLAAMVALPEVLQYGVHIGTHYNHKDRRYHTLTFAAPVIINGVRGNMAATVIQTDGNNYRAHRILMPDGSSFEFVEKNNAATGTSDRADEMSRLNQSTDAASAPIVADSDPNVNLQARDPYQITDREILANAMDSVAKNKDELDVLQRYRARVAELSEKQDQLEQINARIVETRKAGGNRDEIIKDQNRAQILQNQIDRLDKQLQQRERAVAIQSMAKRERDAMRIEYEKTMRKRETEQLNRRLERQQERYDKLKDKYDKDIAEQRQRVKDVRAEKNESFARAKYLDEVRKSADKMRKLLTTPTNKEHVPEFLRAPLGDFIEALDFSSVSSIEGKGSTKADERLKAAMDRLHSALVDVRSRQNGDAAKEYMGYIDLPDGFVDEFNRLRTSIGVALDTSDQFSTPVNRMNSEQLHELAKAFRVLHTSIRNMNRLIANAKYASAINAAADTVSDLEPLVQKNTRNKLMGKAIDFIDWKNAVPYYVFKRFGKGGMAIFEGLMDGWDKLALNADEVVKFTNSAYTTKEVQSWEKEIHDVTLSSGETVRMTTAQLMSLYCLARREQARGHLLGGGIRIADIEGKARKVIQTENYTLTQADLNRFGELLTARQREVADKLQRYMAVKGAEWGNYVSMKRFGYNMFTEANYFPVESDRRNMPELDPQAEENSMYRLLNMSATKGLVQNANNALVVRSIFDVFTGHMSDMAKYNALGLQILDAIKWFNFVSKETDTDGTVKTVSVRKALESAYGDEARKYFNEFMRNLNGETEGGREDRFLNRIISRYKVAATAANLRVALLQITSMPRAAYVISPKYLAIGLAKWNASLGKNSGKAVENVGIAKWKSMGFYDTNISRSMRELIKHDQTVTDKVREGSMKLAEWGDEWTLGVLYGAVEAELKAKGVTEGHPDFKRQMNNRMREIVYQTQVVDSTMTRSHLMRQKGKMAMFTSFMSEQTIAVNVLNDAIFEARMKARSGDKNWFPASLPKVARAIAVTIAVSAPSALVEALMAAFRDDDEFEEFAEKFNKALLGDYSSAESFADYWAAFMSGSVGGNLNVLSNIPIVKNLLESAQGSTAEDMVTKWISTLGEGVTSLYKVIMEPDSTTADYYRAVYKTVNGMSQLTGIAAGGAMRDVVAVYNTFGAEPMGWKRIQTYDNSEKEAAKAIFAAQKAGDDDLAAYYRERFAIYGMDEEKLNKALAKLAEDAYIEGGVSRDFASDMLSESGKSDRKVEKALTQAEYEIETGLEYGSMKEDFVAGTISEEQARAYLKEYAGMRDREIDEKLGEWRYEKDTGYVYSAMKEDYLDGELTEQEAINHRVEYGGADVGDARETVNKWRYEKDTGLVYSEMKLDYEDGVLTESQVRSYLAEYGGKDAENIEETISQYDYYIATGRTTTAPKYWRIAYAYDSGGDADTLIRQAFDEIMYGGEKNKSWKQARSQLASSLAAYYKKDYLAVKGTEKGNRMLERILTLYEKIGYTRSYQSQYIEENWTDD